MTNENVISYERFAKLDPLADVSPSHILEIQFCGSGRTVSVDISRTALVGLRSRLSHVNQVRLDPVLIAGLFRIELALASGVSATELPNITFNSTDLGEVIQAGSGRRQCRWQQDRGGEYLCTAAADPKVRATTDAECERCEVPDSRWRCSSFVHPVIKDAGTFGDPHARMLVDSRCQTGKGVSGSDCQPSGNSCWFRRVSPKASAPLVPMMIDPSRPYSNRRALVQLVERADGYICWYERHMPAKVLEILADGLQVSTVSSVRILSGPQNARRDALVSQLRRFQREHQKIVVEWRELASAAEHHDRVFLHGGGSMNVPPLNTILKGDTAELLPSNLNLAWFDSLWHRAEAL